MSRTRHTSRKLIAPSPSVALRLTHPERVIFGDPRVTKRDLAVFYASVATWMLPHMSGRPLSIVRCPVGTGRTCFFQKHPPAGLPATVKRIEIREKDQLGIYLEVDTIDGLVSLVQHGVIEIHVWNARADDVEKPDRLVFDLDPDPAVVWKHLAHAAEQLREILDEFGLRAFVKTTGGKGLHIVVPIQRRHEWKEVKLFCRGIAEASHANLPWRVRRCRR